MNKLFYLFVVILCCSCSSGTNEETTKIEKRQFLKEQNKVDVLVLEESVFKMELISTGKLYAKRKSNLKFDQGGKVQKLFVKNGDYVREGKAIANLYHFEQKQRFEQAHLELNKATLDLKEALIGQGFDPSDSLSIPFEFMEIAKSRSGYTSAVNNLKTAKHNLQSMTLLAPFSGVIANLKTYENEYISGDEFCLLIDNSSFEVHFSVLETEITNIKISKEVKVVPYSSEHIHKGFITEVNPVVDENGLIEVKALLNDPGDLMEGMNVKVIIENNVAGQLVVSKGAVLQRDNQEVLFKYVGGIAYWTYVQKKMENSTSYSVIAHPSKGGSLEVGDTIIVSGNLNLAHESEVIID